MHQFRVHGRVSPMRSYVAGPACPICMQFFHNRPRTIAHLDSGSSRCRDLVLAHIDTLPVEVVEALDAEDAALCRSLVKKGLRRISAEHPAIRCAGPMLEAAVRAGISHNSLWRNIIKRS